MHIKVMPDYESHPLWWDVESPKVGNIDPKEIGLSRELCDQLQGWADEYDATLNRDDPVASGFSSAGAQRDFVQKGRELAGLVAGELGEAASVRYWLAPG